MHQRSKGRLWEWCAWVCLCILAQYWVSIGHALLISKPADSFGILAYQQSFVHISIWILWGSSFFLRRLYKLCCSRTFYKIAKQKLVVVWCHTNKVLYKIWVLYQIWDSFAWLLNHYWHLVDPIVIKSISVQTFAATYLRLILMKYLLPLGCMLYWSAPLKTIYKVLLHPFVASGWWNA